MGFSNPEQLRDVFLCGGMGFLLGLYYDVFRLFRLWFPTSAAVVFVQDCVYCVSSATMVFLLSLVITDGRLRLFLFVGLVAGFFAYRCTMGRLLLGFSRRVRRQTARFFRCLGKFFGTWFSKIRNYVKKLQKNEKKA